MSVDGGKAGDGAQVPFPEADQPTRRQAQAGPEGSNVAAMHVVGIGASAGGLEALRQLVARLPCDLGHAYVIAQHMAPQHRSMLAHLLGRETTMPVHEIAPGMRVEANCLYVTPPNNDVEFRNGALMLRKPQAALGPKPCVDFLFASLAEELGERAVGIILSGTGTDGARGIRAIKAAGGFAIAQDEATAKYHGMPSAAIDTGGVDLILPPALIGQELRAITAPRPIALDEVDSDEAEIGHLFELMRQRLNIDFSRYKKSTIGRCLQKRLAARRLASLSEYLAFVDANPLELEALRDDILISVTAFFRDHDAFQSLAKVVERIVAEKPSGHAIRVWVPGCASGEEAYSIAILFAEAIERSGEPRQVHIFASDLDVEATLRGRRAIYPEPAIHGAEPELVSKYFTAHNETYQVNKGIRDTIVFAHHDLTRDPPFVRLDLISCRNLLIYFDQELQKKVFGIFHYAMLPGGYLFLGKSESLGSSVQRFVPVDKKWNIFRRGGEGRRPVADLPGMVPPRLGNLARSRPERKEPILPDLIQATLVQAYAPACVVVDVQHRIRFIRGDVNGLLTLGEGTPDLQLLAMVPGEARAELRGLLHQAERDDARVCGTPKRLGDGRCVRLAVHPFAGIDAEPLFLICFEDVALVPQADSQPAEPFAAGRIEELERELAATRENLHSLVQELERSNNDLYTLNQEMQSTNEELQSSIEEMETANEELQSTNEELTTVNQELHVKSAELAATNADLVNIQNSVAFPMVVVNEELRVMRFNPSARAIFDFPAGERSCFLDAVPSSHGLEHFPERLNEVLRTGESFEQQIDGERRNWWLRILPYLDERGMRAGAVITFFDNTHLRRAERQLWESEARFRQMADNIAEAFWLMSDHRTLAYASPAFDTLFGVPRDRVMEDASRFFDMLHPDDQPMVVDILRQQELGHPVNVEFRIGSGAHPRWLWYRTFPVRDEASDGASRMIAGTAIDITQRQEMRSQVQNALAELETRVEERTHALRDEIAERSRIEEDLRIAIGHSEVANRAKTEFLANMSHELRTPLNAIIGFSEMIVLRQFGPIENPTYAEYIGFIADSGKHLLELINDILDVSKIEAGKLDMLEERVAVDRVLLSALRLVRERAERGKVALATNLPPNLPSLYADERRLKQIFLNLLSNAVKFTPEGGHVEVGAGVDPDGCFLVTVTDTGIGMSREQIPKALSTFGQVDSSMIRRYDGAGLGLPLTKGLVELHGGFLGIDSTPGQGTTVTVAFPKERVGSHK